MTYYRVKAECDNRIKYVYVGKSNRVKQDGILVGNELYTPAERKRIANAYVYFDKVDVSPRKTYWFFGARFAESEVVRV